VNEDSDYDSLFDKGCLLDAIEEAESRPLPEYLANWMISSGFRSVTVRYYRDPTEWEVELHHLTRTDLPFAREAAEIVRQCVEKRGFAMPQSEVFALLNVNGTYRIMFRLYARSVSQVGDPA
jgi:hypothetical protein